MTFKKLTIAILSTFILTIAYQVLASYMTSPEGFKYPNPGNYPGQIGPGTFNCSGNSNCFWNFPNALLINSSSGKLGIGTTNPSAKLDVNGSAKIGGDLDMGGNKITNLATPIANSDATTKGYVDAQVSGGGGYSECYAIGSNSNLDCDPGYTAVISTKGTGCGITSGQSPYWPPGYTPGYTRFYINIGSAIKFDVKIGSNVYCSSDSTHGLKYECLEEGSNFLASAKCYDNYADQPSTVALCCK